ncbi:uncharacterized protein J4E92_007607 [Alternaria infectoria]|uniref:uncharacterized protein n=1 Tax=Alternaria conjuncta TaxID=181017 RepID=UPI0022201F18|nr:uncharacterized protein J4E85_009101 [Alternaria conjuncta]XP_051350705.1 uncharacterized protein J4E92_007607 [Alternaria infectoria]KAI4920986.1 hypothetical protein J4E85_009101 [Alternaria conjuncta]KAI4923633.1 hypothetical protein J4E92_007607 [Alternaria infectoria]
MFFFFTCGTHTFTSRLAGTENLTLQCQNCGNNTGRVMKRWEWFTFCFIPVIPFSLKPRKEVGCHVCNFWQDIKYRPELAHLANGGKPQEGGAAMPMNGYGGQGPPGGGAPPGYGPPPQGVPQYK